MHTEPARIERRVASRFPTGLVPDLRGLKRRKVVFGTDVPSLIAATA